MMPNDAAIATLCAALYSPIALIGDWDHFDLGADDGVCWALKKLGGFDVVVLRGSVTLRDWLADLLVLPLGKLAPLKTEIGHVHAGFYAGMEHVWLELRPLLTQPAIVCGHSLGGARACILAALMVKDGTPPDRRVTFGAPKPGMLDFALLIKDIDATAYRNGDARHHDYVTDLPALLPPFEFVHPTAVTVVTREPGLVISAELGMFAWHHSPLYVEALAALAAQQVAA